MILGSECATCFVNFTKGNSVAFDKLWSEMNAPDRSFILRHKTLDLSQQRQSYDRFKNESRGSPPPWTGSTPPRPAALTRHKGSVANFTTLFRLPMPKTVRNEPDPTSASPRADSDWFNVVSSGDTPIYAVKELYGGVLTS